MPRIDPTAPPSGSFEPGVYMGEVAESTLKTAASSGNQYFNVKIIAPDDGGDLLCYDILTISGKAVSIAVAKLRALGFFEGGEPEDIEAHQLVGKRAWIRVGLDTYQGKTKLKPICTFRPFDCGYYPEESPPPDASPSVFEADAPGAPVVPFDDSSTPF